MRCLVGGSILSALAALHCSAGDLVVTRMVGEQPIRGRYIGSEAYSAYAQGAFLESSGDESGAMCAFQQALAHDSQSVEILTRIMSLQCRLRQPNESRITFEKGRGIDPSYAPLWRERARCLLRLGEPRDARSYGLRAIALDPADEEATLIVADAYRTEGDWKSARHWLEGLVAFSPTASRAQALLRAERQPVDEGVLGVATAQEAHSNTATNHDPLEALDRALTLGRLGEARRLAKRARVEPAELALRAAVLGPTELAAAQSALVLDADPRSSDAWIAALMAADLSRDEAAFQRALTALAEDSEPPGRLASWLLAEILARRVDTNAAQQWLESCGPLAPPHDSLERGVPARLDSLTRPP